MLLVHNSDNQVQGEDADDPINFLWLLVIQKLIMPLPTKLMLRKKRVRDGKSSNEIEHFPVPASFMVRQKLRVSVDMKGSEVGSKRSRHHEQIDMEDGYCEQQMDMQDDGDMDQSSGAEYDMSD
nr:protein PAF1 homolog [Tanacetum cinerariifolium]